MMRYTAGELQEILETRVEEVRRLITDFSLEQAGGQLNRVVEVGPEHVVIDTPFLPGVVRPGGTWSGPSQFEIVDTAGFMLAIASKPPGTDAVTISMSMQFLQAPPREDIRSTARLLRDSGRTTTVTVDLTCPGLVGAVAHATVSYAIRVPVPVA